MEEKVKILILDMFKNKRDRHRTFNNMLYAKNVLGHKGYKIWDFVSQPNNYLFEGITKEDYAHVQQLAYNELMKQDLFRLVINS